MSTHSRIREVFIGEHIHTIQRRHKIKRSEYLVTGRVPVVDQGQQFIAGYIDDEGRAYGGPLPVILFGDHTCTLKYVDFTFAVGADGTQLICPTSDFDIRYFYYSLRSLGLEHFGYERHFKYLREKKILWRPMEDQRKIAAILFAYDDLIENNARRIRILEEMAQTIYREWFVNFRFPGHEKVGLVDSELGKIPEGWEVSQLGHLVEFMKGKKPAETHSALGEGDVPLLLIAALRGAPVQYCQAERMILAEKRDIIMVMDGASSGDVYIGFEGAVGSTLAKLRVKNRNQLSHHIIYHFLRIHREDIKANNVGSAIPHANKDYINGLDLLIPPERINLPVDEIMESNRLLIENLLQRNMCLRQTSDLLLPRLISGGLDVSNLDIVINDNGGN